MKQVLFGIVLVLAACGGSSGVSTVGEVCDKAGSVMATDFHVPLDEQVKRLTAILKHADPSGAKAQEAVDLVADYLRALELTGDTDSRLVNRAGIAFAAACVSP